MSVNLCRSFVVLMLAVLLSACQSVPTVEEEQTPKASASAIIERNGQLESLTQFQFGGGLGVWTDQEAISARVQWVQDNLNLDLNLKGPAGLGEMQLVDKDGEVLLLRGKTVVTKGTSADEVVQRGLRLRAAVPVDELKSWVRGLPGNAESVSRDSTGKLADLRYQDGVGTLWSVRFKRYENVEELELPALITASGGEYSVRLLLKNWQLNTNSALLEEKQPNKRLPIPGR